jgi:hypothetical protein
MQGANTTIDAGAEIFASNNSTQAGTGKILFAGSGDQTLQGGNGALIVFIDHTV